jgi:hypothetical protein
LSRSLEMKLWFLGKTFPMKLGSSNRLACREPNHPFERM